MLSLLMCMYETLLIYLFILLCKNTKIHKFINHKVFTRIELCLYERKTCFYYFSFSFFCCSKCICVLVVSVVVCMYTIFHIPTHTYTHTNIHIPFFSFKGVINSLFMHVFLFCSLYKNVG